MNEDHHPVGRPSAESGRAEIDLAKVRERMEGAQIAVVLSRREATALLDRIEELEGAVAPFARLGDEAAWMEKPDDKLAWGFDGVNLSWGDFRRARKALSGEKP